MPASVTPHDLRRTCRSELARLSVPEIVAKKILGHAPARSDVTASVYDQYEYIGEMATALMKWQERVSDLVSAQRERLIPPLTD